MRKRFCTTGTCIPEKNYMVDISERIDRIISEYIENAQYFTINRARQYGKTTTLYLLERKLKENYIVLSLSFEAADEYFQSLSSLAEGLVLDIGDCLKEPKCEERNRRRMVSAHFREISSAFSWSEDQFIVQSMWQAGDSYDR